MYRAALIGLGHIAWRFDDGDPGGSRLTHAACYAANASTKIVGGCSTEKSDREAFERKTGVRCHTHVAELLEATRPDIVSICSPTALHRDHLQACLQREVSMVWLEKPAGSNWAEHGEMLDLVRAKEGKSKVLVNYQRRYTPSYQRLKRLYREQLLGCCRHIQVNYSRGLERNGSHMLDMLFYLMGEEVRYTLGSFELPGDDENVSFHLRVDDGPAVTVIAHRLGYHCLDIILTCDEGRAAILQGGMETRVERKQEHELFPGFYRLLTADNELLGPAGPGHSMEKALEDLIGAHTQGRDPASSLATTAPTQRLIHQVRTCAA